LRSTSFSVLSMNTIGARYYSVEHDY
jgi:hypothetical protein